jgi:hypothetical protein
LYRIIDVSKKIGGGIFTSLQMEAQRPSETLVTIYQYTRRHVSEDMHLSTLDAAVQLSFALFFSHL